MDVEGDLQQMSTISERLRERVEPLVATHTADEIAEMLNVPLFRVEKAIEDLEPPHDKPRAATIQERTKTRMTNRVWRWTD